MSEIYRIAIELSGNINGDDFTGTGYSEGDRTLGNPSVNIAYSSIPRGTNVLGSFVSIINMLSTLLSREIPPAKGFLSLTGGDYSFSRSVEGPSVKLYTYGNMQRLAATDLKLTSRINGNIDQPPSATIERWEGVQLPDGPGRVRELMILPVRFDGKEPETVYIVTSYNFNPSVTLPSLQIRQIEIAPQLAGKTLSATFKASIRVASAASG